MHTFSVPLRLCAFVLSYRRADMCRAAHPPRIWYNIKRGQVIQKFRPEGHCRGVRRARAQARFQRQRTALRCRARHAVSVWHTSFRVRRALDDPKGASYRRWHHRCVDSGAVVCFCLAVARCWRQVNDWRVAAYSASCLKGVRRMPTAPARHTASLRDTALLAAPRHEGPLHGETMV